MTPSREIPVSGEMRCKCGHMQAQHEFEDDGAASCCMAKVWVTAVGAGEPKPCMCPGFQSAEPSPTQREPRCSICGGSSFSSQFGLCTCPTRREPEPVPRCLWCGQVIRNVSTTDVKRWADYDSGEHCPERATRNNYLPHVPATQREEASRAVNLEDLAGGIAREICGTFDVRVRRGVSYRNSPQQTIAIIIAEAMKNGQAR